MKGKQPKHIIEARRRDRVQQHGEAVKGSQLRGGIRCGDGSLIPFAMTANEIVADVTPSHEGVPLAEPQFAVIKL